MIGAAAAAQQVDAVRAPSQREAASRASEIALAANLHVRIGDVLTSFALFRDEPMGRVDEAGIPQRARRLGNCHLVEHAIGNRDQPRLGVCGKDNRKFRRESLKRRMDGRAFFQRTDLRVQRVEQRESEHVLGVNCIGIAQPGFNLGDGKTARPFGDRRRGPWLRERRFARCGHVDRLRERGVGDGAFEVLGKSEPVGQLP